MTNTLARLSPRDWELLAGHSRPTAFRRGDTLLEEGSRQRRLLVIRSGAVRVERLEQGKRITLAQLGAGEIFGEMGFVEDAPASASVIADEDGVVDVLEAEALQGLIASEPGFAVRFYYALAITLAERLRATSARLAQVGDIEAAQVNRFRSVRTGNITARQVPAELAAAVERFAQAMSAADHRLRASPDADAEIQAEVSQACDDILLELQRFTESEPLVDMGFDDLLSFRDTSHLEAGVGDFVYRETFPKFMLSATIARCYAKPRGFPDDYETIAAIYRSRPEGDGRLGELVDAWFLNRPICRTRRASRDLMRAMLEGFVSAAPPGGPIRIASLGSGVAAELIDLCRSDAAGRVLATCVDLDADALVACAHNAERAGVADRFSFLHTNALPAEGQTTAMLPHSAIYALDLCEYLDDGQAVALLDRIFAGLVDNGVAVITNLAVNNPDRGLMEHILDWRTWHRSADELRDVFARSRFGARPVEITCDETAATLVARCSKIPA
jgi:CRP-like cAMP-binding protein